MHCIEYCRERYWDIPKSIRIEHGLRQDGGLGFSGFNVLSALDDLLRSAFRGAYPIETNLIHAIAIPAIPKQFLTPEELVFVLNPVIIEFEARLEAYSKSIEQVSK